MNIRKAFLILFTAVVLVCCTACGTGNPEKEVRTVAVWSGDSHSKDFMLERVSEFNKTTGKENGIKIEYVVKADASTQTESALKAGEGPEFFVSGGERAWLVENKHILALEEISGGSAYAHSYDFKMMDNEIYRYKGKTYTVPFSTTTYGLAYNKEMFKKAGIVDENGEAKPPETLEEMREVAKKLTNPEKQEYGIIFPAKWNGWCGSDINDVASVSSGFMNGYNPVTGLFEYETYGEIMKLYIGIKEDGSCVPGSENLDNDPARAMFSMGKIGMKFVGSYDYAVLTEQFPTVFEWGVALLPRLENYERHKSYSYIGGSYYINSNVREKLSDNEIMLVYEFLTNREMLRESYKAGKSIPYDFEIVRDIELPEKMENWKVFAERVETSYMQYSTAKTDGNGERSIWDMWMDVWNGKISADEIDEIVKKSEKNDNIGIQNYIDKHPDYDYNKAKDPNFDTRLR